MDVLLDAEMDGDFVPILTGIPDAKIRAVILQKDEQGWEFLQLVSPEPQPLPPDIPYAHTGRGHICFEVDDIDEAYRRLEKEGVTFICSPLDAPEVKMFYCEDPGGNRVEMLQVKGF
jgi:catechol 2,3-dioxygenase-like lactoylglutathione lyase family enzyme